MDLFDDLTARGLVHDSTDADALRARLAAGPLTLYHGMDPSADSLHVGNLIGLIVLRRFQIAGHHPIALAGGATGMVGDPSGRSSERNLLDEDSLRANVAAIKAQISRVLGETGEWTLVDNFEWTRDVPLLAFLRDVGKHVTVNQMLARESVRQRMDTEQGISFTEFSYMLLQAFDYWWLHEHMRCELQVGGSDQWGNILSGVDLIRRRDGVAVHALSWPLLTDPSGTKLGKSTGARVWLDAGRTSPYQLFQHFMHTDDRQVRQLLCWFTLVAVEEIDAVVAEHEADPKRRVAQRRLAHEVTALVHGPAAADEAGAASAVLFGAPLADVAAATLDTIASEVPTSTVATASLHGGLDLVDVLASSGLATSKSDARRLVAQNGAYVNNVVVTDAAQQVTAADALHGRFVLLRRGKDRYHLLIAN